MCKSVNLPEMTPYMVNMYPQDSCSFKVCGYVRGCGLALSDGGEDSPQEAVFGHVQSFLLRVHHVLGLYIDGHQVLQHNATSIRGGGGKPLHYQFL